MYLLDSNIFLELLLDQDKADEVERLLRSLPRDAIHISDFSLYSIGIVLFRHKLFDVFVQFVEDLVISGGIRLVRLLPEDAKRLNEVAQRFGLDFDDAYQYVVAKRYGLTIISFDSDFDRTERGCKAPKDLLKDLGVSLA